MNKLLFISLILLAFSCQQKSSTQNTENIEITETSDSLEKKQEDEVTVYKDEEVETEAEETIDKSTKEGFLKYLSQYITESQLAIFKNALDNYDAIDKDTALAQFYLSDLDTITTALSGAMWKAFPEITTAGDDTPAREWKWMEIHLPYIILECACSECDSEAHVSIKAMKEKAMKTAGKGDDYFFDAMYAYYGGGNWDMIAAGNGGNWYGMECDYCSYSTLGGGEYTQMIQATIKTEKETNAFDKELKHLVGMIISKEEGKFGYPKDKVIEELDHLLTLKDSTKFSLSDLDSLKNYISTSTEIQYNCKNEMCNYGF